MKPAPFLYSTLQYRYSLDLGEVLNIGLAFWCPALGFFETYIPGRPSRLVQAYPGFSKELYRMLRKSFRMHTASVKRQDRWTEMATGLEPNWMTENFRAALEQLVLLENVHVAWSEPKVGRASDPKSTFESIVYDFFARFEVKQSRDRVDDAQLWSALVDQLIQRRLKPRLTEDIHLSGAHFNVQFKLGWENCKQQVLQPISLDLLEPSEVTNKLCAWAGKVQDVGKVVDFMFTPVIQPPQNPTDEVMEAYRAGCEYLEDLEQTRDVVEAKDFAVYMDVIEKDLADRSKR